MDILQDVASGFPRLQMGFLDHSQDLSLYRRAREVVSHAFEAINEVRNQPHRTRELTEKDGFFPKKV